MNKKELQEKLNKLELELTEVKFQLENSECDWRELLSGGNFFITGSSSLCFIGVENGSVIANRDNKEHLFKTREQADLVAKKCTLLVEMSNYCLAVNDGWIADWDNDNQKKWGMLMSGFDTYISSLWFDNEFVFGLSVKSEDLAKQMIEEFGDRIKEVYSTQF